MTTQDFVGSTVPEPDDASADVTRPDPALANSHYLSVEPHLVEHGDIILGLHTPVASILTDGSSWFYGDDRGTFIAKRPSWGRVQVLRGTENVEGATGPVECTPGRPAPSTPNVGGWAADPVHPTSGEDDGRGSPALAANSQDDCPPHGITRGRGGLFVVPS